MKITYTPNEPVGRVIIRKSVDPDTGEVVIEVVGVEWSPPLAGNHRSQTQAVASGSLGCQRVEDSCSARLSLTEPTTQNTLA